MRLRITTICLASVVFALIHFYVNAQVPNHYTNLEIYLNTLADDGINIDTTEPNPPSNLVLQAISTIRIDLTWDAGSDENGVSGYQIERCEGTLCETWSQIGTAPSTSYSDTIGLSAGTTYRYKVRAYDPSGNVSTYTTPQEISTLSGVDTTDPDIPPNLVATAFDADEIDVTWGESFDNVSTPFYRLERCQGASCSTWVEIEPLLIGTNYRDSGLLPGITYAYRVRAEDDAGNQSDYSNTDEEPTPADTLAPSVPTGISLVSDSPFVVEISWLISTDNVATPITYHLERCEGNACETWAEIYTTNLTVHDDADGISPDTFYRYRISSEDVSLNESAYSVIHEVLTPSFRAEFASNPSNLGNNFVPGVTFASNPATIGNNVVPGVSFASNPTNLDGWQLLFTRNDTTHDCTNTYIGLSPMGNANHHFDDFGAGTLATTPMIFPLVTIVDSFTRANENPIGSPWINGITGVGACQIITGTLRRSTGTFNCYHNVQYGPNQEVFVTLPNATNHGNLTNSRIYACMQPATIGTSNAEGYALRFQKQDTISDRIMLERRVTGGVVEQLGNYVELEVNNGDKLAMRILADGTIMVWVNTAAGTSISNASFAGQPSNLGLR